MSVQPDTEVKVIVGDEELSTWQRYEIESNMLSPANAFSLTAPNNDAELAGVVGKGDLVKVLVDGELQMVGHVDDVSYSSNDSGAIVEIVGRDLLAFAMDCSAALVSLKDQTLLEVAELLTSAWSIDWSGPVTTSQLATVKTEPGETVMQVLQRLAKPENLLFWMDPDGEGQIGRPNYSQEPLYNLYHYARTSGLSDHNNVISANIRESWREQYSTITVHGTKGNTKADYGKSARAKAIAIDTDIEPERPLIISDGDVKSLTKAQARADLEKDRRAFDALVLSYTVRGHYGVRPDARGRAQRSLFQVDTLADVEDELAGQTGTFLVTRRRFRGDDSGRYTDLELHPKGVWLA